RFYELDELLSLSLTDLQTLWESVPTEEQTYLVKVFEREASKRQIVEDHEEAQLARYFIEQYHRVALVPAGEVWLKVPSDVQQGYREALFAPSESATDVSERPASRSTVGGIPRWFILLAIPMVCLFIWTGVNLLNGEDKPAPATVLRPTFTPSPTVTPTPTRTPTPIPATATPFALSGFDQAIVAGERPRRDYYPVQLQVFPRAGDAPRVFIVQGHEIEVAEWRFDPHPDVVSWLGGMVVRPVLGVPFDEGNLTLFEGLNAESILVVTMNTGNVLQFVYEATHHVTRTDTHFFQQTAPGLVLVLIGETYADGIPTDLRYLVTARYPAEQEIDTLRAQARPLIPLHTPYPLDGFTLTLNGGQWIAPAQLPPDLAYAVVEAQLLTGDAPLASESLHPTLALDTAPSEPLTHDPAYVSPSCPALPSVIPPHTATCASFAFVAPRGASTARLRVGEAHFELPLTPLAGDELHPSAVDFQLKGMTYTPTAFTVSARLFNPTEQALPVLPDAVGLVLGFIPDPTGAVHHPDFAPFDLAPAQSVDVEWTFPYDNEGFATLTAFGRVWSIER
ncbi:MAG: hypothetical protein ACOYLB_16955, partial [Phototrophicaceae bacterium]